MLGTGQNRGRAAALAVVANAVGLVTGRELATGQVQVDSLDARGAVCSVAVRGRIVGYAKHTEGRERGILAGLASDDVAARLLDSGADQDHVWTAVVPGRRISELAAERPGACELVALAQAWGFALARLHTTPVASTGLPPADRPWVLSRPTRLPGSGRQRPTTAQQSLLRLAGTDPGLVWAVRQAADRWSERCLIHADLAGRHVLVATAADTRVRFVDFARAGLGDPDWDVAGALETLTELATGCAVSEGMLGDYFLRGYRRAGGPGQVDPRWRGLWAIEAAWTVAGAGSPADVAAVKQNVEYWLGRARSLVGGARPLGRAA